MYAMDSFSFACTGPCSADERNLVSTESLQADRVVLRIVKSLAPDGDAAVSATSDLRDELGYHSLALVELAFVIEDAFSLDPIPREEAERVRLVGEITEYIEEKAAERGFLFEDEEASARVLALLDDLDSWDADW